MTRVAEGKRVAVHYRGTLDDGTEFDSSEGRDPLEFVPGEGLLIPGFEQAVVGMEVGEEKSVVLEATDAYGARDPDLVIEGPRSAFPAEDLKVGRSYNFQLTGGREADGTVLEIHDGVVRVDFNHPLAGKRLTFRLLVVAVN